MTDPKNSSRWKREKNYRNQVTAKILKERSKHDKETWDVMCREQALSRDRSESVYWYFRHVKMAGENKLHQDSNWQEAYKLESSS